MSESRTCTTRFVHLFTICFLFAGSLKLNENLNDFHGVKRLKTKMIGALRLGICVKERFAFFQLLYNSLSLETNVDFHSSVFFLVSLPTFSLYLLRHRNISLPNPQPPLTTAVPYYIANSVPILYHPLPRHPPRPHFVTNSYRDSFMIPTITRSQSDIEEPCAKSDAHDSPRLNSELFNPLSRSYSELQQGSQVQPSRNET